MIDKIGFFLKDFDTETLFNDKLRNVKNRLNKNGKPYVRGNYENLVFRCAKIDGSLSNDVFISGSLHKYFKKNNYSDFTRTDVKECIDKIENDLDISIKKGIVYTLEIGCNLLMDESLNKYFDILLASPYLLKKIYPTGICFINKKRAICFYDKLQEMSAKNKKIPNHLKGKNILRFELRFHKKTRYQLKLAKPLLVEDLYKNDYYTFFGNRLLEDFDKIKINNFINNLINNMQFLDNLTHFKKYLMSIGLLNFGFDNAIDLINENLVGQENRQKNYRFRNFITTLLCSIPNENLLFNELKSKLTEKIGDLNK